MKKRANDFAWPDIAGRPIRRMRRYAVLCGLVGVLTATSTGCSWLGPLAFWRGDDRTVDISSDKALSPERIATALRYSREQMRLAPQEPYWPFHVGEIYAVVDSTEQAIASLRAALDLEPAYAPAAALLSKIYYETEMYADGVTLLESFITHDRSAPDALRAALALHLEALGELDRAAAVLAECSNNSKEARAARTFVTLRGDDLQSIVDTAKQALEDDPKSAANHNNYGIALLYTGHPHEAREEFLKALDLNDKLPGALYNMAIVEAFYFFDEEAGREWFARYKQLASDDPDNLASLFGMEVSKRDGKESVE